MSIFVEDTPIKVDTFLIEKYNFSLWEFCWCLTELMRKEYAVKGLYYQVYIIKEEIKKLRNLKLNIIKRLDKHQENLNFLLNITDSIEKYKLQSFFYEIDNEIIFLETHRLFDAKNNLTSYLIFHNKVAAIWAQVIKKEKVPLLKKIEAQINKNIETKGIDWPVIADLLEWFKLRFKDTKYSNFFVYDYEIDPIVLRRQYHKLIKNYNNIIISDTVQYLLPWVIYKTTKQHPPKWAKKYIHIMPNEFPPMMIKISKNNIETINIKRQKSQEKIYVIFPTGETLP